LEVCCSGCALLCGADAHKLIGCVVTEQDTLVSRKHPHKPVDLQELHVRAALCKQPQAQRAVRGIVQQ
jgi:hypothetical protein